MLFPTQFLSNIQAHTFCDIRHIWNQEWLNTYLFNSVSPSSPFYPLASPLLPVSPPTLSEMKEKNPWPTPVTIIIIVIGVIAIVALVTVAVLQNKPVPQKYKVKY